MGIRYKYSKNSDREWILFLHGWGGNENSFDIIYDRLALDFSVLSINLSDITSNYICKSLTMHDYIIAVLKVLREVGVEKCHIVCHSFGFRVAIILSRDSTIDIKSMVIIDGAGIKYVSLLTRLKIYHFKLKKFLVRVGVLSKSNIENSGSADYKNLNLKDRCTFKNIVNYDLKNSIRYISCDTMIIWGKRDHETPIFMARYIHKCIDGSVLKIYDTGHYSYIENYIEFLYDIEEHFGKYLTI